MVDNVSIGDPSGVYKMIDIWDPPPDLSTEAISEQARRHLQTCLTQHDKCKVGGTTFLPTRLIDLGPDDKSSPRLYLTKHGEAWP